MSGLTLNPVYAFISLLPLAATVAKHSSMSVHKPRLFATFTEQVAAASCQNQLFRFVKCDCSLFDFCVLFGVVPLASTNSVEKMISFLADFVRKHSLIICCCVITALVWPKLRTHLINMDQPQATPTPAKSSVRVLTPQELAKFDGVQNEALYLSILGSVFDVSKGARHYKPGETYNFFVGKSFDNSQSIEFSIDDNNIFETGKDASVAFITGDFENSIDSDHENDDVLKHLKAQEIYSIQQWKQFYDKEYAFVGVLSGRFYGEDGEKTAYMGDVEHQVDLAIAENERLEALKNQYPPCNIEWKEETGTRVWCTEKSGGIDRDWTGVPRKFFEAGKSEFRCACVPDDRLDDARLKEYDDCVTSATTCHYRV